MPLEASLKKHPEVGLKFCAIVIAILGFYFAKTLSQRDSESMFIIEFTIIVSYCVYMLYIIAASIKLIKNFEKNLNSGFNLSVVFTFLLTTVLFLLGKHTLNFCIGLCPSISDFDLFLMWAQPFLIPVLLLSLNILWRGDRARKRFFFGVLLSLPFCIFATLYSGLTFGILHGGTLL